MNTRYLNLSNDEVRTLIHIRKERFILYIIILLLICISAHTLIQSTKSFIGDYIVIAIALLYSFYILYINRKYLKELILKQKKVYRGVLSFKTFNHQKSKGRYQFNVDGFNFYVDRKNFEYIKEGDLVEFHVSSSTKHLFKVEKIDLT